MGEGCRRSICDVSVASLVFDGSTESLMKRSCNRLAQMTSELLSPVRDIRYLVTSGASRTTHPLISPFILPSTCVEDISPVSNGPVPGVVHGAPGYINWRWIRGLRLMNCGTQYPIDGFGRLYDPAPVSEDDDDEFNGNG